MKPMIAKRTAQSIAMLVSICVLTTPSGLYAQDTDPLKDATDVYRLSQAVHRNLIELGQKMQAARAARDLPAMAKFQEEASALDARLRTLNAQTMKLLDQSISKNPQAKAYFLRAQIHARDGGLTKAVTDLSQAIKLDPKNMSYVFMRARFYHAMPGKRKESLTDLSTVIQRGHQLSETRFMRAQVYAELAQTDKALSDLIACEKAGHMPGQTQVLMGQTLFYAGRYLEAAKYLEASAKKPGFTSQYKSQMQTLATHARKNLKFSEAEQQIIKQEQKADNLPRVKITTSRGEFTLELFEDHAPNTVANFISLIEKNFYDGTRFHRVIAQFMVQGGDPNSRKSGDDALAGTGGPGYTINDEFSTAKPYRKHFRGSLSMANAGPNTGGSQFFITHVPTFWLNGNHTVFGRVIKGQDVVDKLQVGDQIKHVTIVRKRKHAYVPKINKQP